MNDFINIHSHQLNSSKDISIYNNRFLFDNKINTETYFSIGLHPYDVNLVSENSFTELEPFLLHKNCKAIGECGLDKLIPITINVQTLILEKQLLLAVKYKKPVIIHCVKAFQELIEICKPYHKSIPIIIHGFYKSNELANQLISNGFYISINPKLLSNTNFNLNELPLNKLFFETDDNSEISIQSIYKMAADKLKLSETELKEKIYLNFAQLFLWV